MGYVEPRELNEGSAGAANRRPKGPIKPDQEGYMRYLEVIALFVVVAWATWIVLALERVI
jgi:hypothetical protein